MVPAPAVADRVSSIIEAPRLEHSEPLHRAAQTKAGKDLGAGGDPDFRQTKLIPELPGILNWLLAGLKAFLEKGLSPPEIVCDATDAYRANMDLVSQWLEERCTRDPMRDPDDQTAPSLTPVKDLTVDFNAWARDELGRSWPSASLSEKLTAIGFEFRRAKKGMVCVGLRLDDKIIT
jgi:hypothetical protein